MNAPYLDLSGNLIEGHFKGVDHGVYHNEIKAISSTQLVVAVNKTLQHFYEISHFNPDREQEDEKDCYVAGRLAHVMMMERDQFDKMYSVKPEADDFDNPLVTVADMRSFCRYNKIKVPAHAKAIDIAHCIMKESEGIKKTPTLMALELHNWEQALGEREGVKKKLYENTKKMVDAFDQAKIRLQGGMEFKIYDAVKKGSVEDTFTWQDEETGLWLKCKTDLRLADIVLDYKTAQSASEWNFGLDATKYAYDVRAAMYLEGISKILGKEHTDFIYIVQEKTRPYICQTYRLKDEDIHNGRLLLRHTLRQIKKCLDSGNWPAYNDTITEVELPRSAVDRRNSEVTNRNV